MGEFKKTRGQRVRAFRLALKLPPAAFAALLKVPTQLLRRVESGHLSANAAFVGRVRRLNKRLEKAMAEKEAKEKACSPTP